VTPDRSQGNHIASLPRPLVDEYRRIALEHHEAVVRTIARASIPGSVSRVFAAGTKEVLVRLIPTLDLDSLPTLADDSDFRSWFLTGLDEVADAIHRLSPKHQKPGIYPGYKWGHATKVWSLFLRDLVILSRHLTPEDANRIEPWLYCPVDGIVIRKLRAVGVDPGVDLIKDLDEQRFWAIQGRLGDAARVVGVPRVWFDDVWSDRGPAPGSPGPGPR